MQGCQNIEMYNLFTWIFDSVLIFHVWIFIMHFLHVINIFVKHSIKFDTPSPKTFRHCRLAKMKWWRKACFPLPVAHQNNAPEHRFHPHKLVARGTNCQLASAPQSTIVCCYRFCCAVVCWSKQIFSCLAIKLSLLDDDDDEKGCQHPPPDCPSINKGQEIRHKS